ncbi:MAG: hypothetical protein ACLGGX_09000 [Bdellovibrionia bacterium]
MSWHLHFKEQLQLLEGRTELMPGSAEQLRYAIENQLLSEDSYFEYLKQHGQHPIVRGSFFTEITPSAQFWSRHHEKMSWSENLVPLTEWDGHLIIGGLTPPEKMPEKSVFVYTPLAGLRRFWEQFQSHLGEHGNVSEMAPAHQQPSNPLSEIKPLQNKEHTSSTSQSGAPPSVLEEISQSSLVAAKNTESELPEGFDLDSLDVPTFVKSPDALELLQDSADENSVADGELISGDEHDSLDLNFDAPTESPSETPKIPEMSFDFSKAGTPPENSLPNVSSSKTPAPEAPSATGAAVAAKVEYVAAEELNKKIPTTPNQNKSVAGTSPSTAPKLSAVQELPGVHFERKQMGYNLANWEDNLLKKAFAPLFTDLKQHFQKIAVINVSSDEERAKLYAWDQGFTLEGDDRPIPLLQPSVFYIATKTAKPFHGPVHLNEINAQFFKAWNKNAVPEHLTVHPIIVKDSIVALVVAVADASKFNRSTLQFVEKTTKLVQDTLGVYTTKAAS